MSLVNPSAFVLYVQILEFEMDFFSPFYTASYLIVYLCSQTLWAKLIDHEVGSSW